MNAATPVLAIEDLSVYFDTNDGVVEAVKNISMRFGQGETVAIVGESGSGKSQTLMAAIGLLASNGRATGSVKFNGDELLGRDRRALNKIRGSKMTMIFQEPMTSLDPLYRIGRQISEPVMAHTGATRAQAHERALELLKLVDIHDAEQRIDAYPHELSGGQRQRVMIAMSLANNPDLLIADEPTTALDVTVQLQILKLLKELQSKLDMAVVFITHDLNIVKRIADRVYVMRGGEIVEHNRTRALFTRPSHPYTKMLLDAEPEGRKTHRSDPGARPIIEANNISVTFRKPAGLFAKPEADVRAVVNASIRLQAGQTLGVVGESGSGKSTLGRALLRLLPCEGEIFFRGKEITHMDPGELRNIREQMQLVFQDPFGSLSPRMTIGGVIGEGLLIHQPDMPADRREQEVISTMQEVGLDPAMRNRYPHEFSGGQRQRIAIARSMILDPELVVLDEPTSALDRTIQKQIIELLRELQSTHNLTYIFISHDLAVVRALSDEVIVMKHGEIVEAGTVEKIFENPEQAYTQKLISAAFD